MTLMPRLITLASPRSLPVVCSALIALFAAVSAPELSAQGIAGLEPVFRVPGVAMPDKEVTLGAPVDATILSFSIEKEQTVKRNEILGQMDNRVQIQLVELAKVRASSSAALRAAKARLDLAKVELQKTLDLVEKKATTEFELESAQAAVEEAEAGVQAAKEEMAINAVNVKLEEARLEESLIRAPFDGIILDKVAEAGDAVRRSDELLVLINIDVIKVELPIPATAEKELAKGEYYELIAGAPLNKIIVAKCTRIASMMNVSGQSNTYEFTIDNKGHKMRPGFHMWLKSLDPVKKPQ